MRLDRRVSFQIGFGDWETQLLNVKQTVSLLYREQMVD